MRRIRQWFIFILLPAAAIAKGPLASVELGAGGDELLRVLELFDQAATEYLHCIDLSDHVGIILRASAHRVSGRQPRCAMANARY